MSVRGDGRGGPVGHGVTPGRRGWTRSDRLIPWSVLVGDHPIGRDDDLSLTATGVFARVCGLAPGQAFDAVSLAAGKSDSPAEMQAALDELAAAGYLAEVAL